MDVETKFPFANSISEFSRSQDPMRTYRSGVGMGSYLRNDRTIAMYNQSSFGRRLGLAVLARVTDDPPPRFELACCALECSSLTYLKV